MKNFQLIIPLATNQKAFNISRLVQVPQYGFDYYFMPTTSNPTADAMTSSLEALLLEWLLHTHAPVLEENISRDMFIKCL